MHDITLILTFTAALTAALLCGFATHALRLSPIVGYLLAGVAVGPFTPGFAADHGIAEQLAEVGVILLMFGVGLQFHFRELLAVKGTAVPGALVQSAVATVLGAGLGRLAGWEWPAAIAFGGAMSVASTVVLVRVLSDNHQLHTRTGHLAVGWLVVEDLLTVVALVLLPALLGRAAGPGGVFALVAAAIASITLNPLLYRGIRPLVARLNRWSSVDTAADDDQTRDESESGAPHRAVVVGYGPVGQTVTQLLLDNGIEPAVIELNLDTVRRLRAFDVRAVYGDASRADVLAEAGIARARHLLLTAAAGATDEQITRLARELNPHIRVVARTQHVHEMPTLRGAGAAAVFSGEGEVALAMTTSILGHLGASDDQIDRERARVEALYRST